MVWPILPFQRSYTNFHWSYTNFHWRLIFFWSSKIHSKNCIRGNIVWLTLSFQGSYTNAHLTLIYLLVLKNYWRIVSGTVCFDSYFPFQGFYQVFIKGSCFFFLFQKSLRFKKLESQFGLNYIVHFENINLFLSKAQIVNSDQDKIWFEPYCPFKDST